MKKLLGVFPFCNLMVIFGVLTACHIHPVMKVNSNPPRRFATPVLPKTNHKTQILEEKDGPPKGPMPTSFKRIVPVSEPMSRYGNRAAYQVNGRKYEVMTTAVGYRARGLASWYGTRFHSKRTSSGENYDLYELTAAHRTLPLPTYAKVKNLNNGREIIVKVNDRGPFHEGRIIDLSYGAAVKLGLLPKGTAPVEIQALTDNGKARVAHYFLQAGAFSSEKLATTMKKKVIIMTRSPVFIEKYRNYFIVKVGPFATKQICEHARLLLVKHGIKGAFPLLQ